MVSLRVVQGLLLVYDITDRNSYKTLNYWLESIRQVRQHWSANVVLDKARMQRFRLAYIHIQ